VLTRILIGLVAAGAAVIGVPGVAAADPDPAPPPPPPFKVGALAPVKPTDFAMVNGEFYGFAVPGDVECGISRGSGRYGCSGPLPAAPDGATVVTGGQQGPPVFAASDGRPLFNFDGLPKRLLPGTRISFQGVTCGTDGTFTVCNNSFDGQGFVLSPAGSYVLGTTNPLLLNTGEGKNPYFN
jgi:hypothetical protein